MATAPFPLDVRKTSFSYSLVPADSAFDAGRAGFQTRDLGLAGASGGILSATHLRRQKDAGAPSTQWRTREELLYFCLTLRGTMHVEDDSGFDAVVPPLTAILQPAGLRVREYDHSDDFEALVFATGPQAGAATPAARFKPIYDFDSPQAYVPGTGDREFLSFRNFGVADATGRQFHPQLIHALKPFEGGTGWHVHTMNQWFYVVGGSAAFEVKGHAPLTIGAGVAVTLPEDLPHNVPSYSDDYFLIEVCMPADFKTTSVPAPQ